MNYELAKQLKDAGFPITSEWKKHVPELLEKDWKLYGKSYSPTLSELIKACGKEFDLLALTLDGEWWCQTRLGIESGKCKTPEEAVAKLYLFLHEKRTPSNF